MNTTTTSTEHVRAGKNLLAPFFRNLGWFYALLGGAWLLGRLWDRFISQGLLWAVAATPLVWWFWRRKRDSRVPFSGKPLLLIVFAACAYPPFLIFAVSPPYSVIKVNDEALTLNLPAAWAESGFRKEEVTKEGYLRILSMDTQHMTEGYKAAPNPPFNTFWDREEPTLRIVEYPPGQITDLQRHLLQIAENNRKGFSEVPAVPSIKTVKLGGGLDCLSLAFPYAHEELDIIVGQRQGFFTAFYAWLLVDSPSWNFLVFKGAGGKTYEVTYDLPGDRIARWRYRNIFGRILNSLRLK